MYLSLRHKVTLEELLEGCRKGQRKSQEMLYNMLASKMLGVCMRYAKDSYEAEDMLQLGFVKLFGKLGEFRNEGSFEGWVRNNNEGHSVHRLEYEAFVDLAVKEGERIVQEAIKRFGVEKAACVHRVGSLAIGDIAVWVGVSSGHRDEAFKACRYIIDEVKHRVPIWKKEHYASGATGWVNCATRAAG